jgi:hypothetical protein
MRKHLLLVFIITLVALLASCGDKSSDAPGLKIAPTPTASPLPQIISEGTETAPPEATSAPLVLNVEELLSAAEATEFVGQAVTASFDSAGVSETGETSGIYTYELPNEGVDYTDSIVAGLYLIQNGLISPAEFEKGHDAEWAFEDFRKTYSDRTVDVTGLGAKAFYVNLNGDVHVLFQDYYILVVFRKSDTDLEANIALNKSIAAFIIDKISMAGVSLTSPD